jgi:hypothetical protein
MKRKLGVFIFVLVLAGMTAGVVYAQSDTGEAAGGEVQSLLLPLVAAATVVERLIELIFNWYENAVLRISNIPGVASDYVRWAREEVQRIQKEFSKPLTTDEASKLEDALKDAENRIAGFIKNPQYVSAKRVISLILGFVFGLLIAYGLDLRMFALLGFFKVPASMNWLDTLVTGLVVGTGSAPMHSLIGLIQNSKDAVDSVRALWKGEALTRAIDVEKTLEEVARLKEGQAAMTERLRAMGMEGEAALPTQPPEEVVTSRVQMTRRAERLISK